MAKRRRTEEMNTYLRDKWNNLTLVDRTEVNKDDTPCDYCNYIEKGVNKKELLNFFDLYLCHECLVQIGVSW